jgi:2-iminobutanoate/2-iminopropanoate deaminase
MMAAGRPCSRAPSEGVGEGAVMKVHNVDPDGRTPEGIEAQAALAFRNLGAALASAGMAAGDVVKLTVYLTQAGDIPALRAARDGFQGDARPASTLVVVQALARPEWRVEIEAIAARTQEA